MKRQIDINLDAEFQPLRNKMFKSFFTHNLTIDLAKEIKRAKFSIQLVVDESELLLIANELIAVSKKDHQLELVILANSLSKSIKITNLLKRLVDGGIESYWYINNDSNIAATSYGVIDKSFLIARENKLQDVSEEEQVRTFISELNFLQKNSERIALFEGDINATFEVDKPFVLNDEHFQLNWRVANAHAVSILPNLGEVSISGSKELRIRESTTFELIAKNNNSVVKRHLFVKVINTIGVAFLIEVFDPILRDYITLKQPDQELNKIGVYDGQQVKISWECNSKGELNEKELGLLPPKGDYQFICDSDLQFTFSFKSTTNNEITTFEFIRFDDAVLNNSQAPIEQVKSIPVKILSAIKQLIKRFRPNGPKQ